MQGKFSLLSRACIRDMLSSLMSFFLLLFLTFHSLLLSPVLADHDPDITLIIVLTYLSGPTFTPLSLYGFMGLTHLLFPRFYL